MILSCSKCQTQFIIPPEAIGPQGRMVRCGSCAHTWKQMPEGAKPEEAEQPASAPAAAEPAPAPAAPTAEPKPKPKAPPVPAVRKKVETPMALKAACLTMILPTIAFGLIAFEPKMHTKMAGLYNTLGFTRTHGAALKGIELAAVEERGQDYATGIKGVLINEAEEEIPAPQIHFSFINSKTESRYPHELTLETGKATLAPGETFNFEPRIGPIPKNYDVIVMDIGSGWERWLRK